jgi:Uma2 family endonuclease
MTQTTSPKKLLTFAEYFAYDDGSETRYELVDGELVEMPPESQLNNLVTRFLQAELLRHFPFSLVAWNTEIEVMGRRARCRLPDLLVHTEASLAALTGASRATITRDMPPPALAIEVVSPGLENRARDYRYKHTEYAARGIAEYWIVDPEERRITVCQWVEGQYEDAVFTGAAVPVSTIIPAWSIPVEQMFAIGG